MRHNLFLSALLLGASILVTGCGGGGSSDSGSGTQQTGNGGDSQQTGNGGGTQNPSGQNDNNGTTAAGAKLTLDMLKAKTFYTYGLAHDVTPEHRFIVEFNTDASGLNIHNFPGSDSTFSVDGTNSVNDGIMHWHADGRGSVVTPLKIYADDSFMALTVDLSHFDPPYPMFFSRTKLTDEGQSVYDAFMADQTLEKQALAANPWYWVSWDYEDEHVDVYCNAMLVFGADNSVGYSYVKNGSTVTKNDGGTYVISGNTLETDISEGETVRHSSFAPVLVTSDEIVWKKQIFFKNRADAVTFVENMGADTSCYDNFPPQQ